MKVVDHLKISQKLLIPVAGMAALFAFVGVVGNLELRRTASDFRQMTEHQDPTVVRLVRLNKNTAQLGYDLYKSLTLSCRGADAGACQALARSLELSAQDAATGLSEAEALDPDHAADYQAFRARFKSAAEQARAAMEVSLQDQKAEAIKVMSVADPQIHALAHDLRAYNEGRLAQTRSRSSALADHSTRTAWIILLMGAAALVGGLAAAAWVGITSISRPLVGLAERMKALAGGDLEVQVPGLGRRDEIGSMAKAVQVFKENGLKLGAAEAEAAQNRHAAEEERRRAEAEREQAARELAQVVDALAGGLSRLSSGDLTHAIRDPFAPQYEKLRTDFNGAVGSLREAMATISATAHGLRGGAEEISTASDDMSRRTEQQAASLEETAAALDEITATVRRSAEGAKQAAAVVTEAREDAVRSGEVVREAVAAMAEIEQSSNQITQIIGVIDEIAFQTNLLALNAGVEAARAGDVGRGFAVVAQEVRALAQRSADAAKEIKDLITASSGQVERGVQLVRGTGQALNGIVAKVADMDELVLGIAASAQEQSAGLSQVNTAVTQMDQVTQQNAAMVEEATAAAASLKSEANKLNALVGRFRTDGAQMQTTSNPVQQLQGRVAAAV